MIEYWKKNSESEMLYYMYVKHTWIGVFKNHISFFLFLIIYFLIRLNLLLFICTHKQITILMLRTRKSL